MKSKTSYSTVLFLILTMVISFPVLAQSVGDACSTAGEYVSRNISGTYTIMICDGSNYQQLLASSDERSDIAIGYDSGACDSGKTGRLRYSSGGDTWEYCDGSNWTSFGRSSGGCSPDPVCPNVGDTCSGTGSGGGNPIFAGCVCYHDTNSADAGSCVPLYATQNNQSTSSQWKTSYGVDDIPTESYEDGKLNDAQIANSSTFPAFKLCKDLTDGGYTDWYLPSHTELDLLRRNSSTIGGFTDQHYWTSTEAHSNAAWYEYFGYGHQSYDEKNISFDVRCVRRD